MGSCELPERLGKFVEMEDIDKKDKMEERCL